MSEEILDVITDLLNALEAAAVDAKQRIARITGVRGWDPGRIKWMPAEGSKGPYERSEDVNNPEFKAMLKDLAAHNGRVTREDYFYWVFQNGSMVGRKRRGRREAEAATDLEKISERFPEDLKEMLTFEEMPEYIVIRPRQFLGSENFARIAAVVRDAGGEYVSTGKQSHFRIPRKAGE